MRRASLPATRTTVATVFSCVASRNKRGCRSRGQGVGVTLTGSTLADGASGGRTRLTSCGPPVGRRPARAPRTAIPDGIALFALNLSPPPAEEQRAPTSCSPPRGVAANCAALRAAKARPFSVEFSLIARSGRSLRGPQQRQLRASATGGFGPRDPKGSQEHSPKFDPILRPTHSPTLSPARRENRIQFSRPKNEHAPKLAPILRPVSASLRLRFRSAALCAPGEILSKRTSAF